MNTKLIQKVQNNNIKRDIPNFKVGDTLAVHTIIRDGEKRRIQIFKGLVIAIQGGGTDKTFTVRKISYGVGVEKIFPLHSTNIEKIEVIARGKTRRAKLFYLRERIGKMALKVKPGQEPKQEFMPVTKIEAELKEEASEPIETAKEVSNEEENSAHAEPEEQVDEKEDKKEQTVDSEVEESVVTEDSDSAEAAPETKTSTKEATDESAKADATK